MTSHDHPSYNPRESDEDLAARIAAGDEEAVNRLLEAHLPRLRAFVRLRLGPRLAAKESASDVVQSACRDVLGRIDQFQHGGASGFRAWLFNAAARKVADRAAYWNAQRRNPDREVATDDEEILGCYAALGTPSARAHDAEALDAFERVFANLSDDDREVIVLSRIVGLTRSEIARELGRSEASIRNLLPRALGRLAIAMDADSSPAD